MGRQQTYKYDYEQTNALCIVCYSSALPVHLDKPSVSGLPQLKTQAYFRALCLATFWSAMENFTDC
jgi:hypothetical protein